MHAKDITKLLFIRSFIDYDVNRLLLNDFITSLYLSILNSLRCLSDMTRSDIVFTTFRPAGFTKTFYRSHVNSETYSVLSEKNRNPVILFTSTPICKRLFSFVDSDLAESNDLKSTRSTMHTFHGSFIHWLLKKSVLARGACKGKYIECDLLFAKKYLDSNHHQNHCCTSYNIFDCSQLGRPGSNKSRQESW